MKLSRFSRNFREFFGGISNELLNGLLELAQDLASDLPLATRVTELCRITADAIGCDRCSVFQYDGEYFRGAYNYGNPPDIQARFPGHRVSPNDPLIKQAIAERRYVMLNDTSTSPLMDQRIRVRARISAIVAAPFFDESDAPLGFITVEFNENPGKFSDRNATLLMGVARLVSIAITTEHINLERLHLAAVNRDLAGQVGDLQRLESLGRLAGGVAHDFNNYLTVILGHSSVMQEKYSEDEEATERLSQILASVEQATDLTSKLLTFGRRQPAVTRTIELNDVLKRGERLLRSFLPESITLVLTLDAQPVYCKADETQLMQMVLNLVTNARDAIGTANGSIVVTTSTTVPTAGEHPGLAIQEYASLMVADTGPGIAAEDASQIFEPFFTTKQGSGHGMGLASVFGIVRQHQGSINIRRDTGTGATFEVLLPLTTAGEPTEELSKVDQQLEIDRLKLNGKSIIVVDDNKAILTIISSSLTRFGCNVRAFFDAMDALNALASDTPPDLLISDVVMPQLNGPALVKAYRTRYPNLPVLFLSGYAEQHWRDVMKGTDPLLNKPFSPDDLVDAVASTLLIHSTPD